MHPTRFEIFRNPYNSLYYFKLISSDGSILLNSKGYSSKNVCIGAINRVKSIISRDNICDLKQENNQCYYIIYSTNGKAVCRSRKFDDILEMESELQSLKYLVNTSTIQILNNNR